MNFAEAKKICSWYQLGELTGTLKYTLQPGLVGTIEYVQLDGMNIPTPGSLMSMRDFWRKSYVLEGPGSERLAFVIPPGPPSNMHDRGERYFSYGGKFQSGRPVGVPKSWDATSASTFWDRSLEIIAPHRGKPFVMIGNIGLSRGLRNVLNLWLKQGWFDYGFPWEGWAYNNSKDDRLSNEHAFQMATFWEGVPGGYIKGTGKNPKEYVESIANQYAIAFNKATASNYSVPADAVFIKRQVAEDPAYVGLLLFIGALSL